MRRYKSVSQRYHDALSQVSWQAFEQLLADWYAAQGYRVEHVGTAGSGSRFDGGIDLKLFRADECVVVQCKHWNVYKVTHNPVHELLGVMLTEGATGAIVITSGEFTDAARAASARVPRVQLVDGAMLRQMLGAAAVPAPEQAGATSDAGFSHRGSGPRDWDASAGRGRRGSRPRRSRNPLPGMLFAVLAGLATLYIVRQIIAHAAAVSLTPRAAATAPRGVVAPVAPVAAAPAMAPVPLAPSPQPVIYRQSPMTEAQLRDWKRRNAEAMKILERTTPELPLR